MEKTLLVKSTRGIVLCSLMVFSARAQVNFSKDDLENATDMKTLSQSLSSKVLNDDVWPDTISVQEKSFNISYAFNSELTSFVKKLLRRYYSAYTSVVVLDNNTGKVLTAIDYTHKTKSFGRKLTLSSSHPAASVFKVITAANLLEKKVTTNEKLYSYNGKSTTLYKYQLRDKKNRWTRTIPFHRAFAWSNNVIFAKAAQKGTSVDELSQTAKKFGFGSELMQVLDLQESRIFQAEDKYSLAELASGFNRQTLISPLHGAIISSVVANNGVLRTPHIVSSIYDQQIKQKIWAPKLNYKRVLSTATSTSLENLMNMTVSNGTASAAFRREQSRAPFKNLVIGGKTGSITGGEPFGKRDWFVSYAKPKESEVDTGISVCVMIINLKKWYVKAPFIAKEIIRYYYDAQDKV